MPAVIISVLALLLVAWLIGQPWLRQRRRQALRRQPFPEAWRHILRQRVPLYQKLPTDLQLKLKGHIQILLAEKQFTGCQGLTIDDDMRVTIAAHAGLLLLNRPAAYYPNLRQILVYPGSFVVQRDHTDGVGVAHRARQVLAGESWSQGQVVLSWQDTVDGAAIPDDGQNVAIHEFAHQLDQQTGWANGAPELAHPSQYQAWAAVLGEEFRTLQARVTRGAPSLLGDYAATDPAEFFAVASEVFFEQPGAMAQEHPALYQQFTQYYQVDPRGW
ncbi:MAG: zinc-dependent peptidase [Rhodoferax sp.]|uniref:M90 family metallopeptidase n=1 Tax=Rhodoferax sp. TaxID=50421 RepID=UPI001B5A98CA|nr:M90 family metallopeptidase [Rhodoferax sp.]MBP9904845.1 zinc-dependent peptidase [Rhodoferax sp.]